MKSIGVLCSGGDAPGMNAAIRAVVRYGIHRGVQVYGIERGYAGLLEEAISPMDLSSVANIIQRGGTILKTSRCPEFHQARTRARAAAILRDWGLGGLVVIGGDGSYTGAMKLTRETRFPTIGIPGTIDNDISHTEDTIGFDTAVNTALSSIDKIRDTASSHDRLFVVEVMGRHCGMIATYAAIGGGAESVIVPEQHASTATLVRSIERGIKRGKRSSIIVVAEGKSSEGRGAGGMGSGAGESLARELKRRGYDPKVCILGHTQRGGTPTAKDRTLASAMGAAAVDFLLAGKSGAAVGNAGEKMILTPFARVLASKKKLPNRILELIDALAS